MPVFPFTRAKPLGFGVMEVLTSAQANIIDANAAQAADGLAWTDAAALRNWTSPVTVPGAGSAIAYVPFNDTWWVFTVTAGVLVSNKMYGGGGAFGAAVGPTSATTGTLTIRPRAVAFDPINLQLVVGVVPTASSSVKYRLSLQSPIGSWIGTNSSQTDGNGIMCIGWAPGINMLISGHQVSGVVETSIDGGFTWINRTLPNAESRLSIASNAVGVTVITSEAATTHVLQSNDGVTWNQRILPSSKIWAVVYVPILDKFFAIADDMSAIVSSTDGITWTSIGAFTLPPAIGTLLGGFDSVFLGHGRMIVGVVLSSTTFIVYSRDGGLSWKVASTPVNGGSLGHLGSSGKQLLYTASTSAAWSVATGF